MNVYLTSGASGEGAPRDAARPGPERPTLPFTTQSGESLAMGMAEMGLWARSLPRKQTETCAAVEYDYSIIRLFSLTWRREAVRGRFANAASGAPDAAGAARECQHGVSWERGEGGGQRAFALPREMC